LLLVVVVVTMIVICVLVILLLLLSLTDWEDGGDHGGKAGVALNLAEKASIEARRARVNSSKIGTFGEVLAEGKGSERREEEREEMEEGSTHGGWAGRMVRERNLERRVFSPSEETDS
jgi:hypothetical protein